MKGALVLSLYSGRRVPPACGIGIARINKTKHKSNPLVLLLSVNLFNAIAYRFTQSSKLSQQHRGSTNNMINTINSTDNTNTIITALSSEWFSLEKKKKKKKKKNRQYLGHITSGSRVSIVKLSTLQSVKINRPATIRVTFWRFTVIITKGRRLYN